MGKIFIVLNTPGMIFEWPMAPVKKNKKDWQVYLLECSDKSLYCGVTNNLDARIHRHNSGLASKYTRCRLPVFCVAKSPFMTKQEAFAFEYRTKRLPRANKIFHVTRGNAIIGAS